MMGALKRVGDSSCTTSTSKICSPLWLARPTFFGLFLQESFPPLSIAILCNLCHYHIKLQHSREKTAFFLSVLFLNPPSHYSTNSKWGSDPEKQEGRGRVGPLFLLVCYRV